MATIGFDLALWIFSGSNLAPWNLSTLAGVSYNWWIRIELKNDFRQKIMD